MDKIEFIESFIAECDSVLDSGSASEAKQLEKEILSTFSSEINNIQKQLDTYSFSAMNSDIDYIGDIKLLKKKLQNHSINIQDEINKRNYKLELARLKQPNISANAEANQTTNVGIEINIEQVIRQIDDIPNKSLSEEDKDTLKEYIYSLEGVKATKNKSLFWNKSKEVLKFLVDKGADAAISILPYIIEGLT